MNVPDAPEPARPPGDPSAVATRPGGAVPGEPLTGPGSGAGRRPLAESLPEVLLAVTLGCLAVGGLLHAAGAAGAGDGVWLAGAALGAAYSLQTTVAALRSGRVGVDLIAVLALVGASAVGESLAAAVISVMVTTGRSLESWAAGRARRDLRALVERAPRVARRYEGASLRTVPVEELVPGDRILVGAGEVVPADGALVAPAVLDESALTGEPAPVERDRGEPVRSGVVNAAAPFDLQVTVPASASTYAGLIRLVAEAEAAQAPFVRLADRYALWFLGLSLAAAAGAWGAAGAPRAVAVLVVATPCPLILAAPVALVAGLSRSARRGVVVKGGAVLERLARCTTLLIDKTGTLTSGRPTLAQVMTAGSVPADELLGLAGSLEQASPHVLARAVVDAAVARESELALPERVEEVAGQGIRGMVSGRRVAVGRAEWTGLVGSPAWVKSARRRARLDGAITVFVSVDGQPAGVLLLEDPLRPDAANTIRALRRGGVERIVLVTGDRPEVADAVGAMIGVDEVLANRAPADKLDAVRIEQQAAPTVMVGDGINDAPALALADVGVAMGSLGATASSEAADAVLTVDRLDRLGEACATARHARRVALESVVAGMAMSLGAMVAAGWGVLPPVWGATLQEGIDASVILNALRALRPLPGEVRLDEPGNRLATRFQAEHVAISAVIDAVRAAADRLGSVEPEEGVALVREVHRQLAEDVAPHEAAEERELYPALDRLLGGRDPTAPMSRAHAEIAHQIRRLGQMLEEVGPDGPDPEETDEMRALLYGLHAVLRLHTTQEEESYLSLGDERPRSGRPGTGAGGRRRSA